jgi:hypothetical protein
MEALTEGERLTRGAEMGAGGSYPKEKAGRGAARADAERPARRGTDD